MTEYSPGLRDASWQHWSGFLCGVSGEEGRIEVLSGRTFSQGLGIQRLDKEGTETKEVKQV